MSTKDTYDVAAIMGALYGDGIIALKGAFGPEWSSALYEDIIGLFDDAMSVPR